MQSTTKSRAEAAGAYFREGYNCAQAVLAAYCDMFGLDETTALRISCGLGAGMGRRQETCGAVSGAYLLIGLKHGMHTKEDNEGKEQTYALVREFARQFEQRNGTTVCRELLGIDLACDKGRQASERVNSICPKMVRDAAEIIEEMLFMQKSIECQEDKTICAPHRNDLMKRDLP